MREIYELTKGWRGDTRDCWGGIMYTEIYPGKIDGDYARITFGRSFDQMVNDGRLVKVEQDGDQRL